MGGFLCAQNKKLTKAVLRIKFITTGIDYRKISVILRLISIVNYN